jgi:hypothetical protein
MGQQSKEHPLYEVMENRNKIPQNGVEKGEKTAVIVVVQWCR